MSRAACYQSTYELHPLPRCKKCKIQLQLVTTRYEYTDGSYELKDEWLCPKCNRTYSLNKLKEEEQSEQDRKLHEWCKKERKRNKSRK